MLAVSDMTQVNEYHENGGTLRAKNTLKKVASLFIEKKFDLNWDFQMIYYAPFELRGHSIFT